MFLQILLTSPLFALAWLAAIFISLTVHEFSHALASKILGDKTAEREGRLTLNPIAHIDILGIIPLLLFGFGWAKPVPFNPYNLKNPKWGSVIIAVAGPFANLLIAVISALIFRWSFSVFGFFNLLPIFLFLLILLNLFLLFFNIVPIHPLDGSKLFFALFDNPKYTKVRSFVAVRGPQILLIAIFIAIFTNINIFFFVDRPAYFICSNLIGHSCSNYFVSIFSAL